MTTDANLRAYLDASPETVAGRVANAAVPGWFVAEIADGACEVVWRNGDGLVWCAGDGDADNWASDITRHAPLRLAAPDLPCGHPAACVRPTEGHAGTTRWCGWCAEVATAEDARARDTHLATLALRAVASCASDEREQLRREVAALRAQAVPDFDLQAGGRGMTMLECVKAYPEGVVKAMDMVREHVAALTAERDAAIAEAARLAAVLDDTCQGYNRALDRVQAERDALRAQVTQMKVAALEALRLYARHGPEGARLAVGDLIDAVCDAVGIDRGAPYREGGR